MRTVALTLRVKLDEAELATRARQMAELRAEMGRREYARKIADKEAKAEIQDLEVQLAGLDDEVRHGMERLVDCEVKGGGLVVRLDTGEEVDLATIAPEDRQLAFAESA